MNDDTTLFQSEEFARKHFKLPARVGHFHTTRFPSGELGVKLSSPVKDRRCVVLANTGPADASLLELLLLCHTLCKEDAARVELVSPYCAYGRQDRNLPSESWGGRWLAKVLAASGIGTFASLDAHSDRLSTSFDIPFVSLSPAQEIARDIHSRELDSLTLVAPDKGAVFRCRAVQEQLASGTPLAVMRKERKGESVTSSLIGVVSRRAAIVDDILDTGATLVAACHNLAQAGVQDIHVYVTHGLFSGNQWPALWEAGVRDITVFDTTCVVPDDRRIRLLSCAPLIRQYMERGTTSSKAAVRD